MFPQQRGTDLPGDALFPGGTFPREPINVRRLLELGQLSASSTPRRSRAEEASVLEPADEVFWLRRLHVFDLFKADL